MGSKGNPGEGISVLLKRQDTGGKKQSKRRLTDFGKRNKKNKGRRRRCRGNKGSWRSFKSKKSSGR